MHRDHARRQVRLPSLVTVFFLWRLDCGPCARRALHLLRCIFGTRVISADRIVWCRGTEVTTSYLKPFFGHILDPQGKIKVRCTPSPLAPQPVGPIALRSSRNTRPQFVVLVTFGPSWAQVVRTMQVIGSPHVFAGGDACMRSPLEYKCIRTALRHSAVIANNIVRMTRGIEAAVLCVVGEGKGMRRRQGGTCWR
jgi:hypothetical protein